MLPRWQLLGFLSANTLPTSIGIMTLLCAPLLTPCEIVGTVVCSWLLLGVCVCVCVYVYLMLHVYTPRVMINACLMHAGAHSHTHPCGRTCCTSILSDGFHEMTKMRKWATSVYLVWTCMCFVSICTYSTCRCLLTLAVADDKMEVTSKQYLPISACWHSWLLFQELHVLPPPWWIPTALFGMMGCCV
jgi:hypothetical protein